MAYTKLFSTIVTSSIWVEDDATRIVWITLLALSNKDGEIMAAIPGLARMAGVSVEACEKAIQTFLSPDPYSRTKDEGGRRLEVIDGGWALINHAKYRRMASDEERKEQAAVRQKRFRDRVTNNNAPVTHPSRQHNAESEIVTRESRQNSHTDAEANTDSDTKADTNPNTKPKRQSRSIDLAGFDAFWALYPRKVKKSDAVTAWAKLNAEDVTAAMASLPLHINSVDWQKEDGKYVPHPERWLNKRRWEDELKAAVRSDVQAVRTTNDELGFLNNDDAIFHK